MLASSYAGVAQDARMVSAADPRGIVDLLELTGREPQLGKDNVGDPKIELDLGGYSATLLFYGCDADTHDKCNSLQLQAGFDRKQPWTAQEAINVAEWYRFASVQLDKEGDPWLQWDIVTGDGIPAKVSWPAWSCSPIRWKMRRTWSSRAKTNHHPRGRNASAGNGYPAV